MELGAPALVRGVLRQHGLAQSRAHRGLPAGVGAHLTPQDADRIVPLLARPIVPALDGGDAEADRLAGDRMAPLPRRKLGRRCRRLGDQVRWTRVTVGNSAIGLPLDGSTRWGAVHHMRVIRPVAAAALMALRKPSRQSHSK